VGGRRPPTAGGRDLPEEFTFKTFSDWIRHALEEELERSWEIKMNGVGVPERTQRPQGLSQPAASGKRLLSYSTLVSDGYMSSLRSVLLICETYSILSQSNHAAFDPMERDSAQFTKQRSGSTDNRYSR